VRSSVIFCGSLIWGSFLGGRSGFLPLFVRWLIEMFYELFSWGMLVSSLRFDFLRGIVWVSDTAYALTLLFEVLLDHS
jgi:hypothetical protein